MEEQPIVQEAKVEEQPSVAEITYTQEQIDGWIKEIQNGILAYLNDEIKKREGKLPLICVMNGVISAYLSVVLTTKPKDGREAFLDTVHNEVKGALKSKGEL